jgi:hypothetical protein
MSWKSLMSGEDWKRLREFLEISEKKRQYSLTQWEKIRNKQKELL